MKIYLIILFLLFLLVGCQWDKPVKLSKDQEAKVMEIILNTAQTNFTYTIVAR